MPYRKKPNTLFLPPRIKRVMQKDEEVGKVCATVPVIAARALEQFLEEIITKTASITMSLSAKTLTPEHIRQYIFTDVRLSFLHDLAKRMATSSNNNNNNNNGRSVSTNRHPLEKQLSIPYQDPLSLTTSSNQINLLYINQQLSRSYSDPFYTIKQSCDPIEEDHEDDNKSHNADHIAI